MQSKIYDLDDQVREYFEFTVKGNQYKFRHMNTEESEQLRELNTLETSLQSKRASLVKSEEDTTAIDAEIKQAAEDTKQFMYQFITPANENTPAFSEVAKQMITPQWNRFTKMVETESKS